MTARLARIGPRLAGMLIGILAATILVLARARSPGEAKRATARAPAAVIADDRGALAEVLMHYLPEFEPSFGPTYRDFLGSLAPETRVVLVIPRDRAAPAKAFLDRIDPSGGLAGRTRIVEITAAMGIWSKDRALVLSPEQAETKALFLVPSRSDAARSSRPADWPIVPAIRAALPERFEVRELPLAFDGGDFAIAGKRVIVDANLLSRNRGRGLSSASDLRGRVNMLLARDVVVLGAEDGDVPRHHMSMYMTPLDGETVLVGDPRAGARIVGDDFMPGERSPETHAALRADLRPEILARFDRAATELAAAGFRVVRIPTISFDDKTYFAYTNGIYETRGSEKIAWMPWFDVPALDEAARAVYEAQGWRVVPVHVRAVYIHHGTIGCLVNVLARTSRS